MTDLYEGARDVMTLLLALVVVTLALVIYDPGTLMITGPAWLAYLWWTEGA